MRPTTPYHRVMFYLAYAAYLTAEAACRLTRRIEPKVWRLLDRYATDGDLINIINRRLRGLAVKITTIDPQVVKAAQYARAKQAKDAEGLLHEVAKSTSKGLSN